ncbi:MAG TPA: arginine deiminase-related protein [Blastocatellia bacterium]|nr:arginine deiminase-related protein [Blastocatellia bacterium]
MITRALVRGISDSYTHATVQAPPPRPIDLQLARSQHHRYIEVLQALGLDVIHIPQDPDLPDCCFIEDCALLHEGLALITNPGAPSRGRETNAVRSYLGKVAHKVEFMVPPATLDGGDCLRIENRIYVGLSSRSNAEGAARVRETFAPAGLDVIEVPVRGALHLKSVCSYLGNGFLVLAGDTISPSVFGDVEILPVSREEAYAANCLAINGTVICSAGYPVTQSKIKAAGFDVVPLDMSEIKKGDGSLTCLSILF